MKIGVALFTYKRTDVLKTVLAALKSIEEIDTLYIFQDGVSVNDSENPGDAAKWQEVNRMINQIDWCRTIISISKENKGCAASIIMGINKVLEENDAVIVIEDDCVPHEDFISFMKQGLEKYEGSKQVYNISGYAWPIEVAQPKDEDVYFCGRTSSWGWGTWRDRWEKFSRDYLLLEQVKQNQETSARFGLWGNDLEAMLIGNLKGTVDAWDVFWALLVINEGGYCLNPYQSLIRYEGFDGEGRHCAKKDDTAALSSQRIAGFRFPPQVEISPEIEDAIVRSGMFKSVKDMDGADSREKILVYGAGDFYRKHERYLFDNYKILAYIDRNKRGFLNGKDIIRLGGIKRYDYDKIIVMLENIGQCIEAARALAEQGVDEAKIVLGHDIMASRQRFWDKSEWANGGLTLHIGEARITVAGLDEFNNVAEAYGGGTYVR
ncbi:MAG: hypothetical protein LBI54_03780 [Lachnospiraceae bacterium]|jgi:hypothetical protein|nr:hypothetical protein [Lachnospiraceae bacterium]